MKIFGRYHNVREWWMPTGGLSAPFLLDRIKGQLLPYQGNADARAEWGEHQEAEQAQRDLSLSHNRWQREIADAKRRQDRQRLADKFLRQGADLQSLAAIVGRNDLQTMWIAGEGFVGSSQTTLALSNNYTIGSAGNAMSGRLQVHQTRTLNEVYYHITGFTGTAANVNDINIEVRPEASAGAITPHTSTLTDSGTSDPASTTGWIKKTGFTAALTATGRYFVIVGDADGSGTDFATLLAQCTTAYGADPSRPNKLGSVRTTGGFASGNTAATSAQASLVLKFADGTVTGNPLTAATAPANDTNRRGLRMTASFLTAAIDIFGVTWSAGSGNISGFEIWTGTTGPSGTADHVSTDILYVPGGTGRNGAMVAAGANYRLAALTAYSIVATFSGATAAGPQRQDIGTGEDATLRLAMFGGGELYYRRANGTSDWSNDLVGSIPTMGVLVDAQVAAAGGGGIIVPGGFRGGMQV